MFKPLLRLTLVHMLWRNYKRHLVVTFIAVAAIVVISLIHSDYLNYAQQQHSNQFIGWSFVLKWLLYAIICLIWAITVKSPAKPSASLPKTTATQAANHKDITGDEPDPFDFLRHKKKLTSRAEQMINGKKQE